MWYPNSRAIALLLAGLFLSCGAPQVARAQSLDHCVYERDTVNVSGEIHRKRFKAHGDVGYGEARTKTAILLKLRHPLCVMLPDDVTMTPRPRRIHELQLLSVDKLPRSSDKTLQIDGVLMLAQDEDHHLPVLLEVQQVSSVNKGGHNER